MSAPSIKAAAEALAAARASLRPIPRISETFGIQSAGDAYAVQEHNTEARLHAGARITGRKIGLAAEAVQRQLGVDQPDYGMLWADWGFEEGEAAPRSRFLQPRVEAEIAFVLARDIAGEAIDLRTVTDAVAYALPAIEIVDSAIADWRITLADTIADNASAGGYVLGAGPRALAGLDLRLCGMALSRNGREESWGLGAACLGHPLRALVWLARRMHEVGRPMRAGEVVLSGALGPTLPAEAGDVFMVEIAGFAPLQLRFE